MPPYRRNLLICFDAFGTLFKPKRPIAQQYAEVATSLGLRRFTEDEVQNSFKTAFKNESKQNPNYGKANGMNAEKWWSNIIRNTFQPLIGPKQDLPTDLVPKLLHRFWSDEGYMLQAHAKEVLRDLRDVPRKHYDHVVVGLITNSDDRVPDVLSSLGIRMSPLRYASQPAQKEVSEQQWDVDFTVMSYDVGHEKPDKRIFRAAEELLSVVLQSRPDTSGAVKPESWDKIYVGDEYDKDAVAARSAGWYGVLIGNESVSSDVTVRWLEQEPRGNMLDVLKSSKPVVGFSSLERYAEWLGVAL